MKRTTAPSPIRCDATVRSIGSWTIVALPKNASAKLPSRGMVMGEGTINGEHCVFPLEPDGKGSHWLEVTKKIRAAAKANAGDTVTLEITPVDQWPEPTIPADLNSALAANPYALEVWMSTTPMAHWDWVRWIRATNVPATRAKRIKVACSKLKSGMRRPCCFNRSMCTQPEVSKSGVLLD